MNAANFLIFTSRPLHYRAATEYWLWKHAIHFEHLLMRNDDDHRSSVDVKASMLNWLSEYDIQLSQIAMAADDREDILGVYMNRGISQVMHVEIHDVCAYTPRGEQLEFAI